MSLLGGERRDPGRAVRRRLVGVRGVGTLYYAATVVNGLASLAGGEEEVVVWTAIACVIVSIVVHGVTGGPALTPPAFFFFRAAQAAHPLQSRRRLARVEQVEDGLLDHRLVERRLTDLVGVGDLLEHAG